MTGAAAFSAVVLAGGRSSRMGVDKATLPHPSGSTLLERQIALLCGLAPAELLVSVRSGQNLEILDADVRAVSDDGMAGPLGGIVAALNAATQPRLLVVAVDLPYLDADTLRALLLAAPDRGVVPRLNERFEPLAAVYPRSWLPAAEAALDRGERSLQRLLSAPEAGALFEVMPVASGRPFTNWNSPADVA